MNLHMCAKFGINRSSRLVAFPECYVSSALSHWARCLAQKHAKKQHLYIENYNSGPNMQTNFLHSNFRSVGWRARGGVNDMLSACKN